MAEKISVIIPQFGRSVLTLRCVETLLEHHAATLQVIVVDDGSSKEELLSLQRRQLANTEIVRVSSNRGVTHAWIRGAELATGKHLIFLNNDVTTSGPWCQQLIAPLLAGQCVISGPKFRHEKRTPRHLQRLIANEAILEGWCLAISRVSFNDFGGFDERFRLYFSDTDFQLRIVESRQSSDSLHQVRGLPVSHHPHRTTSQLTDRSIQWRQDRDAFEKKWFQTRESIAHADSASL